MNHNTEKIRREFRTQIDAHLEHLTGGELYERQEKAIEFVRERLLEEASSAFLHTTAHMQRTFARLTLFNTMFPEGKGL